MVKSSFYQKRGVKMNAIDFHCINVFNQLGTETKRKIRKAFIRGLNYRYHKVYFQCINIENITKEPAFVYFLSSLKNPFAKLFDPNRIKDDELNTFLIDCDEDEFILMAV